MQKITNYSSFAAIIVSMAVLTGCSDNKPTLYIYNWADYIAPSLVERFEVENNCHVSTADTFDSNEAMYAKLKAGGCGYDIAVPTSYQIDLMVKEDMLAELNRTNILNAANTFCSDFSEYVYDNASFKYAVPYSISYSGFMYSKKSIPSDLDVNSWKILESPKMKGRFSLLADIRELVGAGLMYNGYSVNSESQKEIDDAVKTVIKWKHNAKKFDCESYKTEVASGSSWLGHGYSSDSFQVIVGEDESSARSDLGFAFPREGFIISCDEFVILKGSKNKELAEKFINFLFEENNAKENMEYIISLMPQSKAIENVEPKLRELIIPSKDTMKSARMVYSFTEKPEVFEMYNRAYDEILSTEN